ncbi:MAG: hypothetical protein J6Y78_15555 [Paludibacteraceae bacterium]|nr:hypothetical protein [Paludibacteraceae bacterium]
MPTYAVVYFPDFSPYWEKNHYCFECISRTPKVFETLTIPTREGSLEGVVVDIISEAKYPVAVYKI